MEEVEEGETGGEVVFLTCRRQVTVAGEDAGGKGRIGMG
jgi:hypothetical protein